MSNSKTTRAAIIATVVLMAASPVFAQGLRSQNGAAERQSHTRVVQAPQATKYTQRKKVVHVVKKTHSKKHTARHQVKPQHNNASDILAAAALVGLFSAIANK
jgi:ABC-type nickel/cobalt efflux system permease component RcnA